MNMLRPPFDTATARTMAGVSALVVTLLATPARAVEPIETLSGYETTRGLVVLATPLEALPSYNFQFGRWRVTSDSLDTVTLSYDGPSRPIESKGGEIVAMTSRSAPLRVVLPDWKRATSYKNYKHDERFEGTKIFNDGDLTLPGFDIVFTGEATWFGVRLSDASAANLGERAQLVIDGEALFAATVEVRSEKAIALKTEAALVAAEAGTGSQHRLNPFGTALLAALFEGDEARLVFERDDAPATLVLPKNAGRAAAFALTDLSHRLAIEARGGSSSYSMRMPLPTYPRAEDEAEARTVACQADPDLVWRSEEWFRGLEPKLCLDVLRDETKADLLDAWLEQISDEYRYEWYVHSDDAAAPKPQCTTILDRLGESDFVAIMDRNAGRVVSDLSERVIDDKKRAFENFCEQFPQLTLGEAARYLHNRRLYDNFEYWLFSSVDEGLKMTCPIPLLRIYGGKPSVNTCAALDRW